MKERTLIGVLSGLLLGIVLAQSDTLSAQVAPEAVCHEAITIFRDASRFSRRGFAAKNMNKEHDEYTVNGWKFMDMETYIENGDLEGFFLTYTRESVCGQSES